jgi:hypothetical protein
MMHGLMNVRNLKSMLQISSLLLFLILGLFENSHSDGQLLMVALEGVFKCLECTVSTSCCACMSVL